MYSRAHILIQKEIADAEEDQQFKITKVQDENIFELVALIEGLPKTNWENGIFQIYMKFTENYNFEPPSVYFQTIPYHPNIEMATGRPSVDFLDNKFKWRQDFTIKYILKSLQNLLAYPLLDRAVNMDAVFMLKGNPNQYEKVVKQSVIATQRISKNWTQNLNTDRSMTEENNTLNNNNNNNNSSELNETSELLKRHAKFNGNDKPTYDIDLVKYFENENSEPEVIKNNKYFRKYPLFTLKNDQEEKTKKQHSINKIQTADKSSFKKWTTSASSQNSHLKNISFEEYSILWKGIATSKATTDEENVYLKEGLLENPHLLSQHLSISIKELEEQVYQQLSEHKNIMYGKFDFSNRSMDLKPFEKTVLANKADYLYERNIYKIETQKSELELSGPKNSTKNIEIPKSPIKVKPNNREEFNLADDFDENEVDELINWTKNIV